MLNRHRRSLEEEFPAAGIDMLLSRKYMSDEESDDEHLPTGPILVLRSSYRSNNVSYYIKIHSLIIYSIKSILIA